MRQKIIIIVIVILFLVIGFFPYRYKENDLDVIRRNENYSDVSCYYSLFFNTVIHLLANIIFKVVYTCEQDTLFLVL